jgi:hypothetical protein
MVLDVDGAIGIVAALMWSPNAWFRLVQGEVP